MIKRKAFLGILALTVILMFGCSPDLQIGIRGSIQQITPTADGATILVEGNVEEDTSYDKAHIRINKDTNIKDNSNKTLQISDLQEGDTVEVSFIGPVAESYPVQGVAHTITVIRD